MSWLGNFGEGHPYARPTEAELVVRRRQRDAPIRRGRAMVIAAFAYIFFIQTGNWLFVGMRASLLGNQGDIVLLVLQIVFYAALACAVYYGFSIARYVTAILCGLAAVLLFVALTKTVLQEI